MFGTRGVLISDPTEEDEEGVHAARIRVLSVVGGGSCLSHVTVCAISRPEVVLLVRRLRLSLDELKNRMTSVLLRSG